MKQYRFKANNDGLVQITTVQIIAVIALILILVVTYIALVMKQ